MGSAPVVGVEPFVAIGVEPKKAKDRWSGRVDSNHRPPGPEAGDPRYLYDYRVNIFARNLILGTKSTFVGGQLGG